MAAKIPNPAIAAGGYDGRQMKALLGFCEKKNAFSTFYTPFFYEGKMFASDTYTFIVRDMSEGQKELIDDDVCWSIPADIFDKAPLVKDGYFIDEEGLLKKVGDCSYCMNDKSEAIKPAAESMLKLASLQGSDPDYAKQWYDPAFVERCCAVAKAFNLYGMNFEIVPCGNGLSILRVHFAEDPYNTCIVIMAKRFS